MYFRFAGAAAIAIASLSQAADAGRNSILYRDRTTGAFLRIDGQNYVLGAGKTSGSSSAPLDGDVPQVEDRLQQCGTARFRCVTYSFISLVVPRTSRTTPYRVRGLTIQFERSAAGQIRGRGVCLQLDKSGCVARSDGKAPALIYQYDADRRGNILSISAKYYDMNGVVIDHSDLRLVSKVGLKI